MNELRELIFDVIMVLGTAFTLGGVGAFILRTAYSRDHEVRHA